MPVRARVVRLACTLVLMVASASVASGRPVRAQQEPAAPTFNSDVAPLLFEHCASCHRPGGPAPFSLLTYDDVRPRVRQLVAAVTSRVMPPWKPDSPPDVFEGDPRLSEQQMLVFRRWLEAGAPRGEAGDRSPAPPTSSEWEFGPPDLVVHLAQPYNLAPNGPDRLRNFVVPVPLSSTRFVRAWEFRTSTPRVVHHATIMVDRGGAARALDADDPESGYEGLIPFSAQSPDGYFLGWTPGQRAYRAPAEFAWRIDPGNDLIVMLHMPRSETREVVDASLALYFSDQPPSRVPVMIRLNRQDLEIPAGAAAYSVTDSYTLPVDVRLYAIQPHAHYLARTVTGSARTPDGRTVSLLRIPQWDFHWQDAYRYREPVLLPAGTQLTMTFSFDNSSANRANPESPPRRVIWGQRSTDEMADLWLQVVPVHETDRDRLIADVRRKIIPQHIAGYRKMLEVDPNNVTLHDDLALLAWEGEDVPLAVAEFRQSVRLRPDAAPGHYNLGNALLALHRTDEAISQFQEALRLDGRHGLAHQGLGLALAATGRLEQGASELEEAIRILPSASDARYNLGVLRQGQGRWDDALVAFERAVAIDPGHAGASYGAALIQEARGAYRAAIAHFRRALASRPEWPVAETELAWLLAVVPQAGMRQADEALRLAERGVAGSGEQNGRALDVLAAALAASGRYDEAVERATRAVALTTDAADRERRDAISGRLALYSRRQPFLLDLSPVP